MYSIVVHTALRVSDNGLGGARNPFVEAQFIVMLLNYSDAL